MHILMKKGDLVTIGLGSLVYKIVYVVACDYIHGNIWKVRAMAREADVEFTIHERALSLYKKGIPCPFQ